MFCTLVKIVWNNLCSKNQVKPKSFCIPAVYACRKVTGERGHPLESYKYQFFARPNISRRSHQAPVLQPRNCINLPYTCRGTLRHTCMLRKSCRSFWYENTHTRRSTSSRRGKNKTRIYRVCASTKKRVRTHLPARSAWEADAAAGNGCRCVYLFAVFLRHTWLAGAEYNSSHLYADGSKNKRAAPPPTNHGTFSAYKKYDKRSLLSECASFVAYAYT